MSRRQALADANRALEIRRLQAEAALQALHRQQRVAGEARQELARQVEGHAANERDWAAALARPSVDIGVLGLWRTTAAVSRARVTSAEHQRAAEDEAEDAHRQVWAAHARLADAAGTVADGAARIVRRADEERGLQTAEDLLRFRGQRA